MTSETILSKSEFSDVFYLDENVKIFTPEEIKDSNEKEIRENDAGLELAIADGFIELPISFRNTNGQLVEMKAWVLESFEPSCSEGFYEKHKMLYNIYVPSYKRAKNNPTAKMLTRFNVENWYFAIDPSQYEEYKKHWGNKNMVLRDIKFRDPSMVDLGTSIKRPNSMSGTAGVYNNLLAFSRSMGEEKYFTLDDDFIGLAMKAKKGDKNKAPDEVYVKEDYYRCSNITESHGFSFQKFMNLIEDLSLNIRNHGFIGLERFGTVFSLCVQYKKGTRVYSYYLTDNRTQQAHKGSMNNDVIASMEQSKRGLPPGLIEVISYNSMPTQSDEGGLSSQYKYLGTLEKGKCLAKYEPNFAKITERYSRIHHTCDFNYYNKIRLVGTPINSSTRYFEATD